MELKGNGGKVVAMLAAHRGAPGGGRACEGCAQYRAQRQQRQASLGCPARAVLRCATAPGCAPCLRAPCLRISRGSPTCATRSFMLPNSCSTACTHAAAATAAVSVTSQTGQDCTQVQPRPAPWLGCAAPAGPKLQSRGQAN